MIKLPKAAALLVLLLAPLAYGQDVDIDFDERELGYEYCKWMSVLAKDIMTMRQNGKPMSETLPIALDRLDEILVDFVESVSVDFDQLTEEEKTELNVGLEESMKGIKPVVTQLIIGSYDVPVYGSSDDRRRVVSDAENAMFGSCYQGFDEVLSLD